MKKGGGRETEQRRNGIDCVKADMDGKTSCTCSLCASQMKRDRSAYVVSLPPPPFLYTLFCSISFITVSWLRNQAIVQLLDHEGQ